MRIYILTMLIGSFIIPGCNSEPDNVDRTLDTEQKIDLQHVSALTKDEGRTILTATCYSCHNPNSESHDNMLAPPLAGIKYKYKKLYPAEELFIAQMSDFILNPTKANAVMKGPVRRFGLMPKTTLTNTEAQQLVKFIYNNDMPTPKWFKEHFEEEHHVKWEER